MTTSSTISTPGAWRPDGYAFAADDVLPEAVIFQASQVVGVLEGDEPSLRVAYVVDDQAEFTPEGEEINEGDPALNEAVIHSSKITFLTSLTNELWRQPHQQTPERLAASISRSLTRKLDNALLSQVAPTPPDVAPVVGIAEHDSIIDGGTVAADLDALIDIESEIRANDGFPSLWILSPTAYAGLKKLKTGADFNSSLLGAGVEQAQPLLLGLPVLVNNQLTADTGILLDTTAVVSAIGPVRIDVSEQSMFAFDSRQVRGTVRSGHVVVRPSRVAKFTVAAEGS